MKGKTIAAVVVVVLVVASVGGIVYANESGLLGSSGKMNIGVADAPAVSSVSGVYISFNKISLHSNASGWVNYSVNSQVMNILNVNVSNPNFIANLSLKTGTYTTIRLYLNNVSVVVLGKSVNFTLKAPFAFINHPFKVNATGQLNLVIDFNLNSDLNLNSNVFTPYVGFTVSSKS